MNGLDMAALRAANLLAHRAESIDWALRLLVDVDLFKIGVPVLLLLYVWLRPGMERVPEVVVRSVLAVMIATAIGRGLQDFLPPRPRPILALPDFPFPPLAGLWSHSTSSSFPSDHAVLSFAIATAVFGLARRLGLVAYAWAAVVVCFPRLYFGYHYLTDLLAGATLGTVITALVLAVPIPPGLRDGVRGAVARVPTLLTLAVFVLAFEMLGMFQTVRRTLRAARDVMLALGASG